MWVTVSWLYQPHSVHINKICTNDHIPQLEIIILFCRGVLITQMWYLTGELLSSGGTLCKPVVVVGGGPEASVCVGMAMNDSSFVANLRLAASARNPQGQCGGTLRGAAGALRRGWKSDAKNRFWVPVNRFVLKQQRNSCEIWFLA